MGGGTVNDLISGLFGVFEQILFSNIAKLRDRIGGIANLRNRGRSRDALERASSYFVQAPARLPITFWSLLLSPARLPNTIPDALLDAIGPRFGTLVGILGAVGGSIGLTEWKV